MRKVLTFLLIIHAFLSSANHIVGGEIEFIYLSDGIYRIRVIQYFDETQDINNQFDPSVTVSIFSNRGDRLVSNHLLPLQQQANVPYTNPECAIPDLVTSRLVWSADIALDPLDYADSEGYYVVWERCCRNERVVNIVNPLGTGMKYVVEIPPLWRDGEVFINSSPILFQPLSDYACINQLYYIEFTGIDPDGDSLVYSLAQPLNSSAAVAVPIPQPKPHPRVVFADPFSVNNIIPGNPALRISNRGLLTVTPSEEGLYVFSVLVEEFRDGEKLGEVQRDFQMLVISDGCMPPDPPEVGASVPGDPTFQTDRDTLSYAVGDEEKCFDFFVTNVTPGETISLRAEGVNFDGDLENVFAVDQSLIGANQDTLMVQVCVSDCPPVQGRPFIVDFIAGDDACPLPQLDTLRLTINVEPPPNNFPVITPADRAVITREDEFLSFNVRGTDADGEEMFMDLFVPGLRNPSSAGFELETTNSEPGLIEGVFSWDTNCLTNDFSTRQEFDIAVIIDDLDTCNLPNPDTLWLDSRVILPPNTSPLLQFGAPVSGMQELITRPDGTLAFDVTATDADGDTVNLSFVPQDFDPDDFGIVFEDAQGRGTAQSRFSWNLDCPFNDALKDEFVLQFVADDEDKCQVQNVDTLELTVTIDFTNETPVIDRFGLIELDVNEDFELDISSQDANTTDNVTIDFFDGFRRPNSPSLAFPSATGVGSVSSTLSWTPECSLLDGEDERFFDLVFVTFDDACPENSFDSTTVSFRVINPQGTGTFIPPNAFTPNGDGKNDVFRLTGLALPEANIPPDNCDDRFDRITIHDRTGKVVFESANRDFVWHGDNLPIGIYYYSVLFVNSQYRGFVQLLR